MKLLPNNNSASGNFQPDFRHHAMMTDLRRKINLNSELEEWRDACPTLTKEAAGRNAGMLARPRRRRGRGVMEELSDGA